MRKIIILVMSTICSAPLFAESRSEIVTLNMPYVLGEKADFQGRIDQLTNEIAYLTWALIPTVNDGLTMARHPDIGKVLQKIIADKKAELESLTAAQ